MAVLGLGHIEAICRKSVPLAPRHWAWATMLGEARRLSNEGRRSPEADRAEEGNRNVDLLGALAELLLLRQAMRVGDDAAVAYMRRHLFNEAGGAGVEGPDLWAREGAERVVGIDAKSHRAAPRYENFAINAAKHDALKGSCPRYFCVLARRHGPRLVTADLVPYADVASWERRRLGRSLSCNLPIQAFQKRYLAPRHRIEDLRVEEPYDPAAIDEAVEDAETRDMFREMMPGWPDQQPARRGADR